MADRYRWDNFLLDLDSYRLERAGVPLSLEPKAFNLLALVVQRPGHLFSKQEIFEAIWPDTAVTDHALTRVVAQLRRVLGDEAREAKYLETVPTRGYRWIMPVEPVPESGDARPVPVAGEHPTSPSSTRRVSPKLVAAAIFLAGVVGLLAWIQRSTLTSATDSRTNEVSSVEATTSKASPDLSWPVQLTTHAGLDMYPALSPQGDAVAFVSDRSGVFEIYVRALEGTSSESALTTDGAQNVQPAWSPDGKFLAYHSYRDGGIWVIPARGGTRRQVAAIGSHPTWSPDSLRIAYQSDEHADVAPTGFSAQNGSTIWIVDADGGDPRQLTQSGQPIGGHASPAWSRDGRYLTFSVFDSGGADGLWIVTLDSGEAKPLARGSGFYEAVFSLDNSAIYVAGGEALIYRLSFDAATGTAGARIVIPVPGVAGVRGLSLAPDGQHISFAGLELSSQLWTQPITRDGTSAGPPRALTSDTSRRNALPAVSPDGSKVAYMSIRRGEPSNVLAMDIDGANSVQLTSNKAADFKPHWFPDSRRVAYMSDRGSSRGIWSVDIATRREELWIDPAGAQRVPDLDGKVVEFELGPSMTQAAFALMAPPSGRRILHITPLDPVAPRRLTDASLSVGYPAWSPDERHLAVEIKDGSSTQAGVVDVATGDLRRLTNERGQTWVHSWSGDGRKVAAATLRDGFWAIQWIDAATGKSAIITPAGPPRVYVRYPEWSRRGDVVVYERGEMRGNIWMLALKATSPTM